MTSPAAAADARPARPSTRSTNERINIFSARGCYTTDGRLDKPNAGAVSSEPRSESARRWTVAGLILKEAHDAADHPDVVRVGSRRRPGVGEAGPRPAGAPGLEAGPTGRAGELGAGARSLAPDSDAGEGHPRRRDDAAAGIHDQCVGGRPPQCPADGPGKQGHAVRRQP